MTSSKAQNILEPSTRFYDVILLECSGKLSNIDVSHVAQSLPQSHPTHVTVLKKKEKDEDPPPPDALLRRLINLALAVLRDA